MVLDRILSTFSVNPGSYALVGTGAFFAGMAHAPLTAIVLLFEMTQNYRVVLPLMFACVVSMIIHQAASEHNIYALKLRRRGLDIRDGKETNLLERTPVQSAMQTGVDYVRENQTVNDLRSVFRESHHTHYPVLKKENDRVVGLINYTSHWDVVEAPDVSPLIICRDLARTPAVTVTIRDNLLTALEKISDFHVEVLPVVNDNGELVGILSRNDIINAYNRRLRMKREE
jgi:CIC family chloride channel protein